MKPIQLDRQQRQELLRRRHQTHDKRIYERLSAVLWVADGKTRCEVADLLGRSVRRRPVAVRAMVQPIGYLLSVWEGSSPNSRR